MTAIAAMKSHVLEILRQLYTQTALPAPATDAAIEAAWYVRGTDAAAIREACRSGRLTVSFRDAGRHTIAKIRAGNPCKGHDILDKTIKERPGGPYTYDITANQFGQLRGLVGVPVPGTAPGVNPGLAAIWVVDPVSRRPVASQGAPVNLPAAVLAQGITGDYDMHDLLKKGARILAGTPDEESAIDALNQAMLSSDPARRNRVAAENPGRLRKSNYALIRHGAQTSYISYLLGAGRSELSAKVRTVQPTIPDQDKIANISSDICIFSATGEAHILTSIAMIYKYYETRDLLDQIPFYFFFKDLASTAQWGAIITGYATDISEYLNNLYG